MNRLVLSLALLVVGCANNQIVEQAKRESAYRKLIEAEEKAPIPTAGPGPIEMPKEWMDQWANQTN